MFQTTRWSVILAARSPDEDRRAALEQLCSAYRTPVLAYVRRHTITRDEADDLTQAFFLKFLEQRYDTDADPAKGRFRVYLLGMVKHFLSNARDHAAAAKRGGRVQRIELDANDSDLFSDPTESPEHTFDRVWAITVLDRALDKLRRESQDSGKQAMFERVQEFLFETPDPAQYSAIAAELGMRRQTVAVTVHRLRERLRERVRAELAETVSDPPAVEAEMRALGSALVKRR